MSPRRDTILTSGGLTSNARRPLQRGPSPPPNRRRRLADGKTTPIRPRRAPASTPTTRRAQCPTTTQPSSSPSPPTTIKPSDPAPRVNPRGPTRITKPRPNHHPSRAQVRSAFFESSNGSSGSAPPVLRGLCRTELIKAGAEIPLPRGAKAKMKAQSGPPSALAKIVAKTRKERQGIHEIVERRRLEAEIAERVAREAAVGKVMAGRGERGMVVRERGEGR